MVLKRSWLLALGASPLAFGSYGCIEMLVIAMPNKA
jgi:hypothetical protein